jgi:threonine dehydrogenase-like Zn-dependent dehydrogenase
MKAIAVYRGQKDSVHLAELPTPSLNEIPNGRGVLVRLLRCGVDGTDKEINAGEYGAAPDGYDFLTIGHENLGRVEAVGPNVAEFAPGDYVVATVRRRGTSIYDQIGAYDMTTDEVYFERGVSRRHGYMTEFYGGRPRVHRQGARWLCDIAVLAEPLSVSEKGIIQAFEIQRRLKVWQPRRAAVLGAGTIGLVSATSAD